MWNVKGQTGNSSFSFVNNFFHATAPLISAGLSKRSHVRPSSGLVLRPLP